MIIGNNRATVPLMITQLTRFAAGGGIGTCCHYGLLWIMVSHNINPVTASGWGMVLGAVVVYLINYYLTFFSTKKHFESLKRFLPMVVVGFCLNNLILGFTLEYLSLPQSQVAATACQFLFGFLVSRLWVF